MKHYDYWKSFVSSGKIDDYLHYIACTQEESMDELIPLVEIPMASMGISMTNMDMAMRSMEKSLASMDIPMTSMDMSMTSMDRSKEGGFIAGINYRDGNGSVSHAGW